MIERVRVGRTVVRLAAPRPHPALALTRTERPFATRRGGDIRLDFEVGPLDLPAGPPLFDSGGPWRVWRRADGGFVYAFDAPEGRGVGRTLSVDRRFECGSLRLAPARWARRRGFAWLHPVFEVAVHHHLVRHGGLIVHAAGIRVGRQVVLFAGHSGAGKSTLSRLFASHCPAAEVLADDRVVVCRGPHGLEAWGSPWTGQGNFGSPRGGTLRAIAFLEQAPENALLRCPAGEAGLRLYPLALAAPFDAAGVGGALASCDRLVRGVPAWRFRLRKDETAVQAALSLFRSRPR